MKKILLSFAFLGSMLSANAQLPDGSIAPNFTFTDTDGNSHTLYDYLDQGKSVVLDLFAVWCGPCWNYADAGILDDVWNTYGPGGTDEMMVFSVEADPSTPASTITGGGNSIGDWTTVVGNPMGDNTSIAGQYALAYYPTIYLICPNRVIKEVGQLSSASAFYSQAGNCPAPASEQTDVAVLTYEGECIHCEGDYTPSVKIQNNGLSTLTSATISISQGGNVVSTGSYSGSLDTYGVATVSCSAIANFTGGALNIEVTTTGDASASNNNLTKTIGLAAQASSTAINIDLVTDRYASETDWRIKNAAGTVVASCGTCNWSDLSANGTTVRPTEGVDLNPNQCYTFEILDSYGDGICCAYGNGSYTLSDANGTTLATGGEFDDIDIAAFKTGAASGASIEEIENIYMNVFPNPATTAVNVVFEANNSTYNVSILDLQGRVVSNQVVENVYGTQTVVFGTENIAKGSYVISVKSNGNTTTKNVVIK